MNDDTESGASFERGIVEGPLHRSLWRLAWRLILQNMIDAIQGIVDHAMVGRYVGHVGNAAVGISVQIFMLVVIFVASVFTGMSVLVARFAGAGDEDRVNQTTYQGVLIAAFLGFVIVGPLGWWLAPALLNAMNAEPVVRQEALPYLRIRFISSIGLIGFFAMSEALRAAGDARTPLHLGVVMTVLNIVLNVVLVGGLGPIPALGTRGAAIGTAVASLLVSAVLFWRCSAGNLRINFSKLMSFAPDSSTICNILRFGLPTGIQGITRNAAGLFLFRFVGSLVPSAQVQAAYAVAYREIFSALIIWPALGLRDATATVAGQNLGAHRPERSERAPRISLAFGMGIALAVGVLFLTAPGLLLGVFAMEQGQLFIIGKQLLAYLAVAGGFVVVAQIYTGALQGTGDTKGALYISMVSETAIPIGLCMYLQWAQRLDISSIWFAIVLGYATQAALSVLRFRRGRWRDITIN